MGSVADSADSEGAFGKVVPGFCCQYATFLRQSGCELLVSGQVNVEGGDGDVSHELPMCAFLRISLPAWGRMLHHLARNRVAALVESCRGLSESVRGEASRHEH